MKVLFVIRDMVNGGAGKQLALTANALSQKGHEVFVYSYYGGENQHKLLPSVRFIAQNPVPKTKLKEYLLTSINIRKQIKQLHPDIAISWRCNAGCFTKIASLGLSVKTIFSERTDPYTETSIALKISAYIASFSNGGVFQTEAVRKYYRRLYSKSVVIHNPFDGMLEKQTFPDYESRKKEIVHIARMVISHKRQDIMLQAFKIFLKNHSGYTLSFYGDGVDLNRVQSMAKEMGIENSVIFHGDVIGAAKKIGTAKLLVLTSDYEGIPNVIMEAFAMGVPVVSTDCSPGGARILIEDSVNGYIAPVGDSTTIARKMSQIVDCKKIAEDFITNSCKKLKLFDPDMIFQKWNTYIENI